MTAPLLDRPIIVLGCNRSGTTLLFNNLSWHPDTWSLYVESQDQFYHHYPIDPELGDRLTAPPTSEIAAVIHQDFYRSAHNKEIFKDTRGLRLIPRKLLQRPVNPLYKRPPIRLVEKTPANTLRVPFLKALFPDAKFIFLVRRGEDVVSSLMEGWKNWSKPRIGEGPWRYTRWHYLVPPGWKHWTGKSLAEICAFQWAESNRIAWEDLNRFCPGRFLLLRHEEVMADPAAHYARILEFCELRGSPYFDDQVGSIRSRVFTTGGSAPRLAKWRELHGADIEAIEPVLAPVTGLFYE